MLRPDGEDSDNRIPSPLWGGARGRGNPDDDRSAIHPSPSLPHEGGGNAADSIREDANGPIWRDGAFHADQWHAVPDDGALPDGPIIVSKKRWRAEREVLADRSTPLGLRIEPGEVIDDLGADLGRFALVALSFPKFSDGRAFSTARLLREKHGFAGELRAVGNVLADQIPFMRRVGFDSFDVANVPTRAALAEGRLAEVTLHYQPAIDAELPADTRPWLRRARQTD